MLVPVFLTVNRALRLVEFAKTFPNEPLCGVTLTEYGNAWRTEVGESGTEPEGPAATTPSKTTIIIGRTLVLRCERIRDSA